jgi:hypothetical protein
MIESPNMEQFVQQQIQSAVDNFVAAVITDETWTQGLEQRIVQHVQDRITARFANIETVPDLIDTVKTSVRTLMQQGHVPGLAEYIDPALLQRTVDLAVEREVQQSLDIMVQDPIWIAKIETMVNQHYARRLAEWISDIDVTALVGSHIDASVDRWQDRLKQDFATVGIRDLADTTELTVSPGTVTVRDQLTAQHAVIEQSVTVPGTLTVNQLVLTGGINTDNRAWNELAHKMAQDTLALITEDWQKTLVDQVLDHARTQGIEFEQVLLDRAPLVQDHALNPSIRHSRLESVATLNSLTVAGAVSLSDTVHVKDRRVGINTRDPEMAFSVWDEEVSVIAGKLRQQHAFVGTARMNSLSLGVNRKGYIEIDTDGLTTIKNLRIDRHRISFATEVPGYSGTRGDWVFNSNPTDGQPFAWVCLGAFRWQPLKAAQ